MPKISKNDGATDESQPHYWEQGRSTQSPEVIDEDPELAARDRDDDDAREGDDVSRGNNSSESNKQPKTSGENEQTVTPSTAPTTSGRSKKTTGGTSTASTEGTSSTGKRDS